MELLQYWRILRKRLWLILLLMVVAAAGAYFFVQQQVPEYTTSTTLYLNPVSPSPLLPYQTTASAQSLANTYAQFMRTRSFASLVVQEMEYPVIEGEVLGALTAESVRDTQFFRIEATHPDPLVAQALANTAAEVLIAENISRQQAQREQLEAQRDPAKILERERLTELEKTLQNELAFTDDRIAALQDEILDLESRPPSEETDQRILDLRGELLSQQSMRVELFGSLAQTQAALASIDEMSNVLVDTAVVVDPAPLPKAPQSQQLMQNLLLAAVAGLGLGVGLAFLLEYIDYTIKTPEELDAVYGLSTLGVIGAFKEENGRKASTEALVTLSQPRSPIAEAFRALRTNIQFASPGEPLHSLLVTSAGPVEGKTSVSANLAVVLAQSGERVILVDCDLRRPRQHRVFGLSNKRGFTDLVADPQDGLESYLQPTKQENLRVLPSGPLPPNPAELLGSHRAVEVMQALKEHADVVVYDTPPAATVTDAVVLSSRVDGVIHVIQAGGTRRDVIMRSKALLEKVGARILGPVLNQVDAADVGYYAYYYYYGYYHQDQAAEKWSLWERIFRRSRSRRRHRREPGAEAWPAAPGEKGGTSDPIGNIEDPGADDVAGRKVGRQDRVGV